jgi:hypothetical protein
MVADPMFFLLDANAVNARQSDVALNELEQMAQAGLVELEYTQVTFDEASHGHETRAEKAASFTWTGVVEDSGFPAHWHKAIEHAVFPRGAQSRSEKNDITALVTAKLTGAVFATSDGASKRQPRGILGSKHELAALGVTVVTPAEALALANAQT